MEAVYYGLPMYTFANRLKQAPLPQIPEDSPRSTRPPTV